MGALALGILAALAWGLHDLCVRRVSRRAHIPSCLLVVLVVGALAQLPLLAFASGTAVEAGAPSIAGVSGTLLVTGAAFTVASYALYRAFAAGPVRLVAPLVGAYPVVTTAFAVAGGAGIEPGHWLAVFAVIGGVTLVAAGVDSASVPADAPMDDAGSALPPSLSPGRAVGWSLLAAFAFAATFAVGQGLAARLDPVTVSLGTRLSACLLLGVCVAASGIWRLPSRGDWSVLALMGVLDAVALGAVLMAGGLPDAVLASVAASLFGVVTIVLARLFLAETMSARQWLGVGVAFAAIGWLSAT